MAKDAKNGPQTSKPLSERQLRPLIEFAESMVEDALFDPDNEEHFVKSISSRRHKSRVIERFELSESGYARVITQPGTDRLLFELRDPAFQADVQVRYDPEEATASGLEVASVTGDDKKMLRSVRKWLREAEEAEDMSGAVEMLSALLSGVDLDDDDLMEAAQSVLPFPDRLGAESPTDEPPQADARDQKLATDAAKELTRRYRRGDPNPQLPARLQDSLGHRPQAIWPILDGIIEAFSTEPADPHARQAWRDLFGRQLTQLRYDIDRGYDWASRWVETCRERLTRAGAAGTMSAEDFTAILSAFADAQIALTEEDKVAFASALPNTREITGGRQGLAEIRGLLDKMASEVGDSFAIVDAMGEAARVLPSHLGQFMAQEFAMSPQTMLRDAVPLFLLSEDQGTRRMAAEALEQIAVPETLSPDALRRMIAIRNWLPPADRPLLDQAIRKARLKGVVCAQWPEPVDTQFMVTTIDGVGAVSMLFLTKGTGTGTIGGLLVKLGLGITDSWYDDEVPRSTLRGMARDLTKATGPSEVNRPIVDALVQHAIAKSVELGKPPGRDLLRVAELVGGADWQDRRIDIAAEAARLFAALPADQRTDEAVERSLRRSGSWFGRMSFTESWYLDDPESRRTVASLRGMPMNQQVDRMVHDLMPAYRAEWAERLLLLGMRAADMHDAKERALGPDFVIAAHALSGDRPIETIEIMRSIAQMTLVVSNMQRR